MRVALLSDVHSNLHALEAVLEDVEASDPDAVAFLGDAVGYNAFPEESVQLLVERCDAFVLGNHDEAVLDGGEEWFNPGARAGIEHSRKQLSAASLDHLRGVPLQDDVDVVHLVHGSPRGPTTEYVFPDTHPEALEAIVHHPSTKGARVIAMGHTHVPFTRQVRDLLVLNVGSVGQPRDGDPRACWALVDTDGPSAQLHRVRYDIEAAAEAVREAGLPPRLASRLFEGR